MKFFCILALASPMRWAYLTANAYNALICSIGAPYIRFCPYFSDVAEIPPKPRYVLAKPVSKGYNL